MSRRGRKLLGGVVSSALVLALPGPAYADNCSGLSDCYGQYASPQAVPNPIPCMRWSREWQDGYACSFHPLVPMHREFADEAGGVLARTFADP